MIKRTSRWIIHRPVRFLVPVSFRIHQVFSPSFFPYFSPHFLTLFSGRTRKQGRRITPPALPCFTGSSCRHITCLISRVFSSCYPQFRSQAASISFRCRPPLLQVAAGLPLPDPADQPFLPFFRFLAMTVPPAPAAAAAASTAHSAALASSPVLVLRCGFFFPLAVTLLSFMIRTLSTTLPPPDTMTIFPSLFT